jgi:hypothetical protein
LSGCLSLITTDLVWKLLLFGAIETMAEDTKTPQGVRC